MILRRFADLPTREIHYRKSGSDAGVPFVLFHASPGSSKQLEPFMRAFPPSRRLIAFDRPGNGDSPPLDKAVPEIADYAAAAVEFLDAMGLDQVDVYGSHTGASIAGELAILAPKRVRKVVFDGIPIYTPEHRDEMLERYALPFTPDLDGAYLPRAFMFCRDQYLFMPWYKRTPENRRANGLPSPQVLHEWVLEVLKAPTTYPLGYNAAFRYPAKERLPLITCPVLAVASEDDRLMAETKVLADRCPNFSFELLPPKALHEYTASMTARIEQFLDR